MTDDPTRPPGDQPPQGEPRKRSTTRGRDWARASRVTAGTAASPAVTKIIVRIAVVVALIGGVVMVVQRTGIPLLREPQIVRPARDPSNPREAEEWRDFATRHFGEEILDVVDDRDFELEPQWRHTLEATAGLDDEVIAKNVRFNLSPHFDELMKDPAAFRGQFVHMRGVVWKTFRAYKLFDPIAGRGDFYRGHISDDDPDSPIVFFDLLDRPEGFQNDGYETVEMDAVFYRTVEYEAEPKRGQKTGPIRRAPWLIAKTFRVIKAPPHPTVSTATGLVVIAAFLALFFAIVYLLRRGPARKAPGVPEAGFRSMFEQRRQQAPPTEGEEPPGR